MSPTLTTLIRLREHAVAEATLGQAAKQRRLPADERDARQSAPALANWPLCPRLGGLAVAGADAAADAPFRLALLAAGVNVGQVHYSSTPRSRANFLAGPKLQQAVDGRLDEIDRVRAAVRLGQDVADAAGLQHLANARAGLDAGARPGRDQDHSAAAEPADDPVRDALATQRDSLLPLDVGFAVLEAFSTAGGTSLALP